MEVDLQSVYAPDSDNPLIVENALLDIFTHKVWIRDPQIHGTGEDNKFKKPPNITLDLTLTDMDGIRYNVTLPIREITINQIEVEPDEV